MIPKNEKAALTLAERGMAVFQLPARSKIPSKGSAGFKDATRDPELISRLWQECPDGNIGIATGVVSGVFVVDLDGEDGEASLRALEKKFFPIPSSVESITPGGGRHIFLKLPNYAEGVVIKNSVKQIAPNIDIRGCGGYVIAPPSLHPNGKAYAWSVDSGSAFADPPVWLVEMIASPKDNGNGYGPVKDYKGILHGVPNGERNAAAARLAGRLFRAGFTGEEVFDLMAAWDFRNNPPLGRYVIARTVEFIGAREAARRGTTRW